MQALLIGCARVSAKEQDLAGQRDGLAALGVEPGRVYVDHGPTGTDRHRPGPREALAAYRAGDTLVVTKLDRLARWLLFNALAMVAEADPIRMRTREGGRVAKAKGHVRGKQPNLNARQEAHPVSLLRAGRLVVPTGGVAPLVVRSADRIGGDIDLVDRMLWAERNGVVGPGPVEVCGVPLRPRVHRAHSAHGWS